MISIELLVQLAQDSRISERCGVCSSPKKIIYAFCPRCYYSLSPAQKKSLTTGSTEDYLRAYVDCWQLLKQKEEQAAMNVVRDFTTHRAKVCVSAAGSFIYHAPDNEGVCTRCCVKEPTPFHKKRPNKAKEARARHRANYIE